MIKLLSYRPASILSSSKLTIPQVRLLIPDVVAVIEKYRGMYGEIIWGCIVSLCIKQKICLRRTTSKTTHPQSYWNHQSCTTSFNFRGSRGMSHGWHSRVYRQGNIVTGFEKSLRSFFAGTWQHKYTI